MQRVGLVIQASPWANHYSRYFSFLSVIISGLCHHFDWLEEVGVSCCPHWYKIRDPLLAGAIRARHIARLAAAAPTCLERSYTVGGPPPSSREGQNDSLTTSSLRIMTSHSSDGGTVSFSPIEYNDHAGYLWIVTILGVIYSSFSGLARASIKRGIYGADDYLIGLATVSLIMSLINASCVTQLNLGLSSYCYMASQQ